MSSLFPTVEEELELNTSERLIGCVKGAEEGPVIIALAGMHGNEGAGVKALRHVFGMVEALGSPFNGEFWGISLNHQALEHGVRFIDEDMNRMWFPSIIDHVREQEEDELQSSERKEMKQLLPVFDKLLPRNGTKRRTVIIDLHSFSAEGSMFTIASRKEDHVKLLSHLHAPIVFGIENTLQGTAYSYFQKRGHFVFTFEGGQHYNKLTVYNMIAVLLIMLREIGCVDADTLPRLSEYEKHLREQTQSLPTQVELVYQHIIEPGDDFKMQPGFSNFDPIKEGEWLATDKYGKIRARCDGFILMPLYQEQGNDGFFVVQEQHS